MNGSATLTLALDDEDHRLSPANLDVSVFAEIVIPLRNAIAEIANESPDIQDIPAKTEAILTINNASEGSCVFHLCGPAKVQKAIDFLIGVIKSKRFDSLPNKARVFASQFSEKVARRNWFASIGNAHRPTDEDAAVSALTPIPPPPQSATYSGETEVFGRLLQAGGKIKSGFDIEPPGSSTIRIHADPVHVIELAKRLYQYVVLEGEATWDSVTDELVAFKLTGIGPYEDASIEQSIEELRQATAGAYDDINPDEFVRWLRDDTESPPPWSASTQRQ